MWKHLRRRSSRKGKSSENEESFIVKDKHIYKKLDKEAEHTFVKEIIKKNDTTIYQHLLDNSIALHLSDIYLACQYGHLEMVKIMFETKTREGRAIPQNFHTKYGWTPLEVNMYDTHLARG